MGNYVTHEELRRALEAMREQEDLGASYRWGLNAALNTLDATLPQQPDPQPIDPLSPAAFKGRTTPDGKPVRWVAWDEHGCCEYSTDDVPCRNHDGELWNRLNCYNSRNDLYDRTRAGQTLWVGQGPDPREQKPALPSEIPSISNRRPLGRWASCLMDEGIDYIQLVTAVHRESEWINDCTNLHRIAHEWKAKAEQPLTIADIPDELRAEIEAAERERCAAWLSASGWGWRVREAVGKIPARKVLP